MERILLNIFVFTFFITSACSGQNTSEQQQSEQEGLVSVEEMQQASMAGSSAENKPEEIQGDFAVQINRNFTYAADIATPSVVHISSTMAQRQQQNQMQNLPEAFREFFGPQFRGPQQQQQRPQQATGSGVIITEDGYIVTNNHVIADASEITVTTSENRRLKAEVIGTDPTTDLALIKVDADDMNFLEFGDSDDVKVGGWVLAVGNPFNLASTVTAGIVSAKARNINILREQAAIESFIQTDAAINPGNSGGALVDLQGQLIGINTAIASPTGAYSGYGFAVPVDIAKKVINDLINYGTVQRGYLGVYIRDITPELKEEEDVNVNQGVYIDSVLAQGAAERAGLEQGDIVVAIDGKQINSTPELQEYVGRQRPGDEISITVLRDGERETIDGVTLENQQGGTEIIEREEMSAFQQLGLQVRDLTNEEKNRFGIRSGVVVTDIQNGIISQSTAMSEGFIISKVAEETVGNVDELRSALEGKSGGVLIEGRYPGDPNPYYYAIGL